MKHVDIARDERTGVFNIFVDNEVLREHLSEDELIEVIVELSDNDYGIFLELLRKSGITNMFGAAAYLVYAFNLTLSDAIEILADWMKNYSREDYE